MLFTMRLLYRVDEKDQKLVQQKLKEYSESLAITNVAGQLNEMSIFERKIEFEFEKDEMLMNVDTFGVDLETEEQEQIEMTMRESYIVFFDSPVTKDDKEVWIDEIEVEFHIAESQVE